MKVLRQIKLHHWFTTAINAVTNTPLVHRKDGVVLAFTALVISVLIFVMALAVDSSIALSERSSLQAAADHSARTAALVLGNSGTSSQATSTARAISSANGYVHLSNATVDVNIPPIGFEAYTAAVEVIITETKDTFFGSVFGKDKIQIKARAVGAWEFAPCIVALGKGKVGSTIGVSVGGTANFTAGCGVYSNSQSTDKSIIINGAGAKLNANGCVMAVAGGTSSSAPNLDCSITVKAPYYEYALPSTVVTTPPSSLLTCDNTCKANKNYLYTAPDGKVFIKANYNYDKDFGEFPNPGSGQTFYLEENKAYFINLLRLGGGGTISSTSTGGNVLIIQGKNADLQVTGGSYLDVRAMSSDVNPMYGDTVIIGTSDLATASITGGSGCTDAAACGALHPGINGIISIPSTNLTIGGGSATSKSCQTYFANSVSISGDDGGIGGGCPSKSVNLSTLRTNNLVE